MTDNPRTAPAVSDIWRARCGDKVAVVKRASILDGGFYATVLDGRLPGRQILVDLDGSYAYKVPGETRPYDLVERIGSF